MCVIEYRNPQGTVAADLARHLQSRATAGKTLVMAARPTGLLSAVRKQWKALERYFERQRSSTLSNVKRSALSVILQRMENLTFTAPRVGDADVAFVPPNYRDAHYEDYATIYVCSELVPNATIGKMLARLSDDAVLVDYVGPRLSVDRNADTRSSD